MLTISADSLPGRIYLYWLEMGGHNRPGYQENFCHFCRVLLIWAPLKFFLSQKIISFVRPWMLAAIAGYIWLFAAYPEAMLAITLLIAIPAAVTLAACFMLTGLAKTLVMISRSRNQAARWLTKAAEATINWLAFKQYGWFRPWMGLVALLHLATLVWARDVFYVIIGVEALIGLMVGFMILRFTVGESETVAAVTQAFSTKTATVTRPIATVGGTLWTWAKAKKAPICPPVQIV